MLKNIKNLLNISVMKSESKILMNKLAESVYWINLSTKEKNELLRRANVIYDIFQSMNMNCAFETTLIEDFKRKIYLIEELINVSINLIKKKFYEVIDWKAAVNRILEDESMNLKNKLCLFMEQYIKTNFEENEKEQLDMINFIREHIEIFAYPEIDSIVTDIDNRLIFKLLNDPSDYSKDEVDLITLDILYNSKDYFDQYQNNINNTSIANYSIIQDTLGRFIHDFLIQCKYSDIIEYFKNQREKRINFL